MIRSKSRGRSWAAAASAPYTIRNTRPVELVNIMDPVAGAFGVNAEGVMLYLADRVDEPSTSSPII